MTAPEPKDAWFARLLGDFLDEAGELLRRLNENLLRLDEWVRSLGPQGGAPGDRELVNDMFRAAHSLKSLSAMLGLRDISQLAHGMENVFDAVRQEQLLLTGDGVELMFQALDRLETSLQALKAPAAGPVEYHSVLAGLQSLLVSSGPTEDAGNQPPGEGAGSRPASSPQGDTPRQEALPQALREAVARVAPADLPTWIGEIRFRPGLALVGLKARLVFEKLARLGTVCYFEPPDNEREGRQDLLWVRFGLSTPLRRGDILRRVRVAGIEAIRLEPLSWNPAADDDPARHSSAAPSGGFESETPPVPGGSSGATRAQPEGPTSREEASALPAAGPVEPASAPGPVSAASSGPECLPPSETLRVEIERLDRLMNLAGQLVITKARLAQIAQQLRESLAGRPVLKNLDETRELLARMLAADSSAHSAAAGGDAFRGQARRLYAALESVRENVTRGARLRTYTGELAEAVHHLDRLTDAIRKSVLSTRMVPIGPLLARFKRVLRDMARSSGKAIRLVINGEKTELDKRMIDELADPLAHIVRNAADHGIEPPEERAAAGKPPEGTVTLNAFHRGNSVVIQVKDDGRGLDADRILHQATEKGWVAPADAQRLTRQQIYDLIWLPGLSTAEKVTEVSGRGLGMDIVKAKIEQLHGTVEIETVPGQGTTLSIKLPLTLAVLPSLMVEAQGETFAVPIEAVREIVALPACEIAAIHGRRAAVVRGRVILVVRLDEVLAWTVPSHRPPRQASSPPCLVVFGDGWHEAGLEVDRVLGNENLIIQSIADNYRNVPGVAGASILGSGRVALILDVATLLERAAGTGGAVPSPARAAALATEPHAACGPKAAARAGFYPIGADAHTPLVTGRPP